MLLYIIGLAAAAYFIELAYQKGYVGRVLNALVPEELFQSSKSARPKDDAARFDDDDDDF